MERPAVSFSLSAVCDSPPTPPPMPATLATAAQLTAAPIHLVETDLAASPALHHIQSSPRDDSLLEAPGSQPRRRALGVAFGRGDRAKPRYTVSLSVRLLLDALDPLVPSQSVTGVALTMLPCCTMPSTPTPLHPGSLSLSLVHSTTCDPT